VNGRRATYVQHVCALRAKLTYGNRPIARHPYVWTYVLKEKDFGTLTALLKENRKGG